jgi:tetratricopeptide (TPR) repeat protein
MEIVHRQENTLAELKISAREAESTGDIAAAEKIYLQVLKRDSKSAETYHRLMIIYRKQKLFAKELAIIERAIETFRKLYTTRIVHNKKVTSISAKMNKAFGLVDKKGNSLYDTEPINGWKKRKQTVETRLKKL